MKFPLTCVLMFTLCACNLTEKFASEVSGESTEVVNEEKKLNKTTPSISMFMTSPREPGLGGPSLSHFIKMNPNILASEIEVLEAYEGVALERSNLALQTDFSLQGGSKSLRDRENGVFGTLSASKSVYDNGLIENNIITAEKRLDISFLKYQKTIDNALIEAIGMFNRYELAAEIMNLAYLKLSMAEQAYANLDKLSVAGQIDAATLAQARQNLNRLKLISSESEIEFNKASAELTELFKSSAKDIYIAIDQSSLDNAIKKVGLESNLDVQLSISELELAKLELAAIQSSGWGNLSFNAQADVPVSDTDDDSDLSIGLIFSKVLGDGGRLKARTKVAKLKVDRSTESVRYNEQNAEISLLTLRQQISRLEKSIKLRDEMITDAYLNVQQLEEQLLIGMSNFSAVLDAHVGLFTLEKDQLVDTGDLVASKLNILAQHGNLLELFNLNLPLDINYYAEKY